MPFGPCPKHGCFKIVGGWGWWRRGDARQGHTLESEFGEREWGGGGVDGEYVEKGQESLVVHEV
jgi:hypothetical protein